MFLQKYKPEDEDKVTSTDALDHSDPIEDDLSEDDIADLSDLIEQGLILPDFLRNEDVDVDVDVDELVESDELFDYYDIPEE